MSCWGQRNVLVKLWSSSKVPKRSHRRKETLKKLQATQWQGLTLSIQMNLFKKDHQLMFYFLGVKKVETTWLQQPGQQIQMGTKVVILQFPVSETWSSAVISPCLISVQQALTAADCTPKKMQKTKEATLKCQWMLNYRQKFRFCLIKESLQPSNCQVLSVSLTKSSMN